MAGGPHFAGICNLFPQNAGLECRKSALLRPIITKFPGEVSPWTPLALTHLRRLQNDVWKSRLFDKYDPSHPKGWIWAHTLYDICHIEDCVSHIPIVDYNVVLVESIKHTDLEIHILPLNPDWHINGCGCGTDLNLWAEAVKGCIGCSQIKNEGAHTITVLNTKALSYNIWRSHSESPGLRRLPQTLCWSSQGLSAAKQSPAWAQNVVQFLPRKHGQLSYHPKKQAPPSLQVASLTLLDEIVTKA